MLSSEVSSDKPRASRSRPKPGAETITGLIIVAIAIVLLFGGCGGDGPKPRPGDNPPPPTVTAPPSREDIIQAVRRSVDGKTYTVKTQRQEPQTHVCSQEDVDR